MGRPVVLVTAAALLFAATAIAARIDGSPRADFLRGGPSADRIDGHGGSDRIKVDGGGRDTVRCGPGRFDLVNADLADRVASDCETVARVIARDPYRAPAQHATIAEPDSLSWGRTIVVAFQSGRFRDGGAVNTGWATSRDGGRTWRSGTLPALTLSSRPAGRWERASDPVVAYDAAHGTWLIASLALSAGQAAAIVVSRSPDGITWSPPVSVVETPWRAEPAPRQGVDRLRQRRREPATRQLLRRLQRFPDAPARVPGFPGRRAHVGAAGLRSGERRPCVDRRPWAPAPQPVVRPNGDLVVPFYDENRVASVRSIDGGRSFQPPVTISATDFKATPSLRGPPLPSAEVDRAGNVYVVWPDCRRAPSCSANDLVLSRSADGVTWSRATRIPTRPRGSRADYVLPGIGADTSRTGRIGVVYYVLRDGLLDVAFISSQNGGRSWRPAAAPERPDHAARLGGAGRRRDARRLLLDVMVGRPGGLGVHARLATRRTVRPGALRDRHSSVTETYARPALCSCA